MASLVIIYQLTVKIHLIGSLKFSSKILVKTFRNSGRKTLVCVVYYLQLLDMLLEV